MDECAKMKKSILITTVVVLVSNLIFLTGCSTTTSLYKVRLPNTGSGNNGVVEYTYPKIESKSLGNLKTQEIMFGQVKEWLVNINDSIKNNSTFIAKSVYERNGVEDPYVHHVEAKVGSVVLVPLASEKIFIIKSFEDALIFKNAFPKSQFTKNILENSLPTLSKDKLRDIAYLFIEQHPAYEIILKEYLKHVSNFQESMDLYKKSPSIKDDAEKKCAELASTLDEYKSYLLAFPDGSQYSTILTKKELAQKEFDEQLVITKRHQAEEAERARIQSEKDRAKEKIESDRIYKSYTPAERAKLESEITILRSKIDAKNSEHDRYIDQANATAKSLENLSFKSPLRKSMQDQQLKESMKAMGVTMEINKLQTQLDELYKKAPWMK